MIIYNAKITNDSRFVISWTVINTDEINLPYTNKDNVPPPPIFGSMEHTLLYSLAWPSCYSQPHKSWNYGHEPPHWGYIPNAEEGYQD